MRLRHLYVIAFVLLGVAGLPRRALAQECLLQFREQTSGAAVTDGASLCQTASGKLCTFNLQVCVNTAGCTPVNLKHKNIRASGHCGPVGRVHAKGNGTSSVCGGFAGVKVRLKKHGKKAGKCVIHAKAGTDKDTITLNCQPTSSPCATTTTVVSTTTTTTLRCGNGIIDSGEVCDPPGSQTGCPAGQACDAQCAHCTQVTCAAIVAGQPIANTYNLQDVMGPKVCIQSASANGLGFCQSDADCGGDVGACLQTPWISAGGINLPFPLGISATYTVAAEDTPPTCSHQACISCGNPGATCAGLTGCNGGNPKCITSPATCCDQPGFVVPTFYLSSLGTCVKVDQKACGVGVVNTSNPQTGDNEVAKMGDTSDPGPDCIYGTGDDPAAKPCDISAGDAGADTKGKVVRTLGNGTPDSSGIHTRLGVSIMATAWTDKPPQSPGAACPGNDTFDTGEIALAQLLLNAELSTAGASGQFADLNGDGCALPTGALGFGGSSPGPITLGPPTLSPAPYGGGNNLMGAAGLVFPGNGPTYDLGFIAVVPFGTPTVVSGQTCSCSPTAGCPE